MKRWDFFFFPCQILGRWGTWLALGTSLFLNAMMGWLGTAEWQSVTQWLPQLLPLPRRYNCSHTPGALLLSWRHLVAGHIPHFISSSSPLSAGTGILQKSSEVPGIPPSFRRSAGKPVGGIGVRWCSMSLQRTPRLRPRSIKRVKLSFDEIKTTAYRRATVPVLKHRVHEQKSSFRNTAGNSCCPPNWDSFVCSGWKEEETEATKQEKTLQIPMGSMPFATVIRSQIQRHKAKSFPRKTTEKTARL